MSLEDAAHSGVTLREHLEATAQLCEDFADESLKQAARHHSYYGTVSYKAGGQVLDRARLAKKIGADAEELVFKYCGLDRQSFLSSLSDQIVDVSAESFFEDRVTDSKIAILLLMDVIEQISRWSDRDDAVVPERAHFNPLWWPTLSMYVSLSSGLHRELEAGLRKRRAGDAR